MSQDPHPPSPPLTIVAMAIPFTPNWEPSGAGLWSASTIPQSASESTSKPFDTVDARMTRLLGAFNTTRQPEKPVLVDGSLSMLLKVQQDEDFQTRLLCKAETYLTLADESIQNQLASTIEFSIFSGKPSQSFPVGQDMMAQWLKEWHTCSMTKEPYKFEPAIKEHVWAVRALFKQTGAPVGPDLQKMYAGPHNGDTLIYISKIITELEFAGKGLLRPTLDLLYEATTHRDLARLCTITGPVCWVLEPGFINTEANEKAWPKLPGEDDWMRSHRVSQTLLRKVYPKVNYTVYREDFGNISNKHSYMGRRFMVQPPEPGSDTGKMEPLASEYPPKEPELAKPSNSKNGSKSKKVTTPRKRKDSTASTIHALGLPSPSTSPEQLVPASHRCRQSTQSQDSRKRKAEEFDRDEYDPDSELHQDSEDDVKPVQKRQKKKKKKKKTKLQRSEGARPLRSNSKPNLDLTDKWRENGLPMWHTNL